MCCVCVCIPYMDYNKLRLEIHHAKNNKYVVPFSLLCTPLHEASFAVVNACRKMRMLHSSIVEFCPENPSHEGVAGKLGARMIRRRSEGLLLSNEQRLVECWRNARLSTGRKSPAATCTPFYVVSA